MARLRRGLSIGAAMVVLTACWVRLGYGLDLSDEAYYVALAYRFALGDIPFEDELHHAFTVTLHKGDYVASNRQH